MWSNNRESMIQGLRFWVRCRTTNITLGTQPSNPDLHRDFIATKNPDVADRMGKLPEEQAALKLAPNGELVESGGRVNPDEDKEDLQMTVFPKAKFLVSGVDGQIYDPVYDVIPDEPMEEVILPFIYDYQFRGSFKESIAMLSRAAKDNKEVSYAASDISAYKKAVDGNWFVTRRKIPLEMPETYIDDLGNEVTTYDQNGNLRVLQRPLRAETAKGPRTALATSEIIPAGTEFWFGIMLLNQNNLKACLETLDYKESMGMLQWRGGGKGTLIWTLCNSRGVPYEELSAEEFTPQDIAILSRMKAVAPEVIDWAALEGMGLEIPEFVAPSTGKATKGRRGAKKKGTDENAEGSETEGESTEGENGENAEAPAAEEKPKRGRKKKDAAATE